jgi:hypothetical protein
MSSIKSPDSFTFTVGKLGMYNLETEDFIEF